MFVRVLFAALEIWLGFYRSTDLSEKDRQWRRGYFSNRNWLPVVPARGQKNSVLSRKEDDDARDLPKPRICSRWQDKAARAASVLQRRREKWQRMVRSGSEPDSSSSSSSSDSSSDCSAE